MISYSIEHLIERVARRHPTMKLERSDVAAWCLEAMEERAPYESLKEVSGLKLPVSSDFKATLPINVYRVLRLWHNQAICSDVAYVRSSRCLFLPDGTTGHVMVDVLTLPIDERGYPLIDDVIMPMCAWYVEWQMLSEPWMRGEVRDAVYNEAKIMFEVKAREAQGSLRNITEHDFAHIRNLLHSAIVFQKI